jgi:hypothetical protein
MTTYQKLSPFRSDDAQELGYFIQKYAQSAAVEASQGKAGAKADKAVVMSYYPHGSAGAVRLNLKWGGLHQVNDFNFDFAGEVQDCQTETDHTGWVILQPHRNFSVKYLLLRGALSFTGLYHGTKFPLDLTASNGKAVHSQNWERFWRVVWQPLERILRRRKLK